MTNKTALLLINLGSPDAPTAPALRKYLFEFLHDKRVIDTSRWIWCPILHGIILRIRPARSAKAYASIWGEEGAEAPLIRITRDQAKALQMRLGDSVHVDIAMRYGNPSIPDTMSRLMADGYTRFAILPMYPQFAGATTASVFDGVAKALKKMPNVPDVRFLRDYHTHEGYISALASSITAAGAQHADVILASFHGVPQDYITRGDPYASECETTVNLLRDKLTLTEDKLRLTFQSRFGPRQWLQPYTDITLEELAESGVRHVAVLTPGFSADCLETLEEMNIEGRETFLEHGGETFTYVPCLNDNPAHIDVLEDLARIELLQGWCN